MSVSHDLQYRAHILQHQISHPTLKLTPPKRVNALKMNFSPFPVGKYAKSTQRSNLLLHQPGEGKNGFEADRVRSIHASHSSQSKMPITAENQCETHFFSNDQQEPWLEDYVERETTGARKQVEDAEVAVQQEQKDIWNVGNAGLMTREPEMKWQEKIIAIRENLLDFTSSDHGEDQVVEDDKATDQGHLSKDDEQSCVMGIISKAIQLCLGRFRQNQIKCEELI